MAFVYVQDLPGLQISDYDRINEALNPDAGPPEGLIIHTASATDSGVRIVDVWESQEAQVRFRDERLMPAIEQAGVGIPPSETPAAEIHEVHHLVKP
jgi:hypothetical protein